MTRSEMVEAFLDELGPVVDGEPDALARHADLLADDDEARDLRFEASETVERIREAGADYRPPLDLEARVLAALDAGAADPITSDAAHPGRTTSPGFGSPELDALRRREPTAAEVDPLVTAPPLETASAAEAPSGPAAPEARAPASLGADPSTPSTSGTQPIGHYPTPSGTVPLSAPHAITGPQSRSHSGPPITGTEAWSGASSPASRSGVTEGAKPAPAKTGRGKLLLFPIVGALGLAAAAAIAIGIVTSGDDDTPPEPTLATRGIDGTLETIDRAADDGQSGVTIQRPSAPGFLALAAGEAIPAGSTLRTDDRTRARVTLADGSALVLNHATELQLVGESPRSFRLADGEVVADVAHLVGAPNARFETATGHVEVLGTKFVLTANEDVTSVRVSRGVVSVHGQDGAGRDVRAGEEGLVRRGAAPDVAPVTELARSMAWSELDGGGAPDADADDEDTIAGIGSLRARRPGERQEQERPLTLARHEVRVRIVGNVARTEIEEIFRNDSDHTLEGVYRFPLPADAQIARLALDVEGRMEEGSFLERDRARQIWAGVIRNATPIRQRQDDEEFIWVPGPWRDPAILEWQRGGQFELRIFPIPAHGERRVILGYTQTVAPQGARRRYVYPLAHSGDDSTRVGHFDVDVRVAGAERVEASGYRVTSAADGDATRLSFSERGFSPKGDLTIDYELPGGERELRWWTYQGDAAQPPPEASRDRDREVLDEQRRLAGDTRPYVALALRPELPRTAQRRDRDFVFVVDASQSMVGERFHRASALTSRLVRELDRRDRFTVLACDYQCRALPGGMQPPSGAAATQTDGWLEAIEPAGASDLVAVLREAVATVSSERRDDRELHVMYLGDGTSSVGYRRAASLAAETQALARAERVAVSTVGIGGDADTMALRAMATGSGGHYVPYVPGERISVAAASILETTYGASLEAPRVVLPPGLSEVAPATLPTIRAGQEVIVVARMDRDRVTGPVTLRGTVGGRPFEQRYPVELVPTDAAGNRFVPRLWAAGRIEEMQLGGRGEDRAKIIAMSKAFGVLSRHTSLLVLESEAMFRAFRVDRREATSDWTGEEDIIGGDAAGEVDVGEAPADGVVSRGALAAPRAARRRAPAPSGLLGGGGVGSGSEVLSPWGGSGSGGGAGRSAAPIMRDEADDRQREQEREPAEESQAAGPSRPLWADMPSPSPQAAPPIAPMPDPRARRRPGQWMQRQRYRVGEVRPGVEPSSADERRADDAEAALRANEDSRDRHREAVRRLMQAGRLERALEITEAWIARDRLDPEALTAKADVLGRMGHRDDALRLLTGTVDLAPESEALHQRLAGAFERAAQPERACAHRIALAEIDEADAGAVAAAMRCERSLGRPEAAARILASIRDASVRTRAEREARDGGIVTRGGARRGPSATTFRGDFTIEAEWAGGGDLDVSIITPQGTRLSWMGGRTTVVGDAARSSDGERLGLRWTAPGTYIVEVNRTDPNDTRPVSGELAIRVLDERRTVPFTLTSEREAVAQVRVRSETRLVPVTGTVR